MTLRSILQLVYILLTLDVYQSTAARVGQGANAQYFSVLCGVFSAIEHPPTNIYDEREVEEIAGKIDVINASLSEDMWFDVIKNTEDLSKIAEDFKAKNGGFDREWRRWRTAVERVGAVGGFEKLSSANLAVRIARAKIEKIEGQVEKIRLAIVKKNNSVELGQLAGHFKSAIGEPGKKARGSNRGTDVCGAQNLSTKGKEAGDDLIVDFLCLCAKDSGKGSSGQHGPEGDECGPDAPGTSAPAWSASGNSLSQRDEEQIWTKLQGACRTGDPADARRVASAIEVRQALRRFWQAVQAGAVPTGTDKWPGLFGTMNTVKGTAGCPGYYSSNPNVCVFYGPSTEWNTLKWPQAVQSGLVILEAVENASRAIEQDVTRLKMLQSRAEEIYEEAKVASELEKSNPEKLTQNQIQNQNPVTSADKSSAQEPTGVSAAMINRFLLPWALLI